MLEKYRKIALATFAGIFATVIGILGIQEKPPLIGGESVDVVVSVEQIEEKQDHFKKALKVVLEHEGYLSNDHFDKGGLTKWGVSLRFLQAEAIDVDGDGDVDRDDILKLTQTDADKIYFKYFWTKNHYDQIFDEKIAIKLFDIAVNTGSSRAHKILKKALNDVIYEPIAVDKTLDDETMQIVNLVEPSLLLKALRKEQAQFYLDIIKITPNYKKFAKGWAARAAW